MLKWNRVGDHPVPTDGKPVIVRLGDWKDGEPFRRNIQIGYFDKKGTSIVGSNFAFDLPEVTHWAEIPNFPEEE